MSWADDNSDPCHIGHPSQFALVERCVRNDPPVGLNEKRKDPVMVYGLTPAFDESAICHIVVEEEAIFSRDLPKALQFSCPL